MRLIDADKILYFKGKDIVGEDAYITQKDVIDEMPTVDAKPVRHGYWLYDRLCSTNGGTYGVQRCSNCGYYYKDFGDEWNYCPHCGASMDEAEEDEKICDNCHYCIEKSNKNKGAELHTIHFKCMLPEEKNVNPDDGCDKWTQRSGKRKIRYKDGEIGEID